MVNGWLRANEMLRTLSPRARSAKGGDDTHFALAKSVYLYILQIDIGVYKYT
jgi:hypothetical protein